MMPRTFRCILCGQIRTESVSLFQFPEDDRKAVWSVFCKIDADEICTHHRLCSKHFTGECFKFTVERGKRLTLRNDAQPSIYCSMSDSDRLVRKENATRSPQKKYMKSGTSSSTNQSSCNHTCVICGTISRVTKRFQFPHDPDIRHQWAVFAEIDENQIKSSHSVCEKHFHNDDFIITNCRTRLKRGCIPTLNRGNKRHRLAKLDKNVEIESVSSYISEPCAGGESSNSIASNSKLARSPCTQKDDDSREGSISDLISWNVITVSELPELCSTDELTNISPSISESTGSPKSLESCAPREIDNSSIVTQRISRRFAFVGDFSTQDVENPEVAKRLLDISRNLQQKLSKIQRENRLLRYKMKSLENVIKEIKEQNLLHV